MCLGGTEPLGGLGEEEAVVLEMLLMGQLTCNTTLQEDRCSPLPCTVVRERRLQSIRSVVVLSGNCVRSKRDPPNNSVGLGDNSK